MVLARTSGPVRCPGDLAGKPRLRSLPEDPLRPAGGWRGALSGANAGSRAQASMNVLRQLPQPS